MKRTLLAVAVALLALPLAAQGLTPQQVMNLRDVLEIFPSPDGQWLLYTVGQQRGPEEKPGPGHIEAFVIPLGVEDPEPEPFPETRGLAWWPGGEGVITYVAKREGDEKPQVYGRPVGGGDETRFSTAPNGIGSYAWRPDGQAFAYTMLDPETELRQKNQERGFEPVVVDEDFRHVSLWLWSLESNAGTRLTEGKTVQDFVWAPTGDKLAVAMSPRNLVDDRYMFTRLYVVEPESGTVEPLVDNPGKLGPFRWSPDGQTLAYITAADRNDPHAGTLRLLNLERPEGEFYTEEMLRLPASVTDETHRVERRDVRWNAEAHLYELRDTGVHSQIMRDAAPLFRTALPAIETFELLPDDRIVCVGSRPHHAREVFVQREGNAPLIRLTDSNPWLADVELGPQEVVRYEARDGLTIEGLLIHPPGDFREPTPLVIVAHGGPEAHYTNGWITRYSEPGQVLAGMGYRVWYPNYRSSTGYGVEFAKQDHGDPMGKEFQDHLDAIEHFAELGLIDRDRVGIIGGSYGGYTAAWAATRHSEHFAAAVSFVPFVDIRTKWLTSDIPWEFYLVHYQEQWPHEQPGFLADRSPLTWAAHCDTPLLLCGGDADPRVHPSQPFMLYRAVKFATDTPVRYVQYPGEGHGNRTNVYRYDYLLRAIRWLDWYLKEPNRRDAEMPPKDLEYPAWR